ncbi:cytoplasmic dynein heavy chain, putative, partial [Perkinsus marinus ATCC 50983]
MGSPEGYSLADRAVAAVTKQQGRWALLTNMHLCLPYFRTLDRKLPTHPQGNFKLFITLDIEACSGQALPDTLMKSARILMFEAPTGVRPSLQRSYAEVLLPARVQRGPVERNRLHFLLAWLHAIVLERVRYAPVGWTKEFDFSEADLSCAVELTDKWLDEALEASSSSEDNPTKRRLINIDPAKIPWEAIRTTLIDVVYGGRLDNDTDREALTSIVEYLFSPKAYHKDFLLNPGAVDGDGVLLRVPDARKREDFLTVIDTLFTGKPTPQWVGLQPEVENYLKARRAGRCLAMWLQLRSFDVDFSMRFGRKLALALQNDTEDAPFISHKHLKEILSRQVREIRSLNDMANKESQEANSSKETIRIMDSHFFATMDSDVEAMLAYIGTKQEGLARSVAALVVRAQQAGLIDQDNQPPNGMLNSTLTQ